MVAVHEPPPAVAVHGSQAASPRMEAASASASDSGGLTAQRSHNHGLAQREPQGVRSEPLNLASTEPPKAAGGVLGLAPLPSGLAPLGSLGHHEATRAGHLYERGGPQRIETVSESWRASQVGEAQNINNMAPP